MGNTLIPPGLATSGACNCCPTYSTTCCPYTICHGIPHYLQVDLNGDVGFIGQHGQWIGAVWIRGTNPGDITKVPVIVYFFCEDELGWTLLINKAGCLFTTGTVMPTSVQCPDEGGLRVEFDLVLVIGANSLPIHAIVTESNASCHCCCALNGGRFTIGRPSIGEGDCAECESLTPYQDVQFFAETDPLCFGSITQICLSYALSTGVFANGEFTFCDSTNGTIAWYQHYEPGSKAGTCKGVIEAHLTRIETPPGYEVYLGRWETEDMGACEDGVDFPVVFTLTDSSGFCALPMTISASIP